MKLRFAPSPTGLLHVGNVRAALANYLFARRHGGVFLLRFDDTDVGRNKPEFATAIEQDLRWLGLDWDESFRQSDRLAEYTAAARRLEAAGRLYPCFESEVELQAKRDQRLRRHQPPVYDRAMLKLTAEQRAAAEAGGKMPYWRFRLSDGASAWRDLVLGDKQVRLPTISDPVLVRADGTPLYTFTSVVDDLATGHHPHRPRRGSRHEHGGATRHLGGARGRPARRPVRAFAPAGRRRWRQIVEANRVLVPARPAPGWGRTLCGDGLSGPARHVRGPGAVRIAPARGRVSSWTDTPAPPPASTYGSCWR